MKRIIALLALTFSLAAFGQKKDTIKPDVDTVYILSKPQMQFVQSVFRQNTIQLNGKVLTFDDVLQVIQSFESKVYYLPKKEQPKK